MKKIKHFFANKLKTKKFLKISFHYVADFIQADTHDLSDLFWVNTVVQQFNNFFYHFSLLSFILLCSCPAELLHTLFNNWRHF